MRLDDFGGFGFVNLVLMLVYLWDHWFEDITVNIDGYVVLLVMNCYGIVGLIMILWLIEKLILIFMDMLLIVDWRKI
jgi:hypothetical protein